MKPFLDRLRPARFRAASAVPPEGVPAEDLPIPIVWLLGKTGAGKSSLVRALTGLSGAEIGSGFAPCTRTSARFDYPADAPLVRFLDTRGLGEAGYDPAEDLAASEGHAHAVLALARIDDPVQGEVAEALSAVLKRRRGMKAILVLTGADLVPEPRARERAVAAVAAQFARATGRDLDRVLVALPRDGDAEGLEALIDRMAAILPDVALLLATEEAEDEEARQFAEVRNRVLFYAGIAGTTDVAPIVGALSVPAAQGAMLRELGARYGATWTRGLMATFLGTMGLGIAARYGASYGLRQIGKLVPVLGQTAVAAASGTISFATTWALGRAAAYFLHHHAAGRRVSPEAVQEVYRTALRGARRGAD